MDLVAIEEIRQLKYRYLRTLDLRLWDEFADTLTPDVSASYGGRLHFAGRDDLVAFMAKHLGPDVISMHHCHHPEITVDGDDATGTWYLEDTVIATEHGSILNGASFYNDRYRRCDDGRWRIAATGYQRVFEAVQMLSDTPTWRLLQNRFSDAPGASGAKSGPGSPPS